MLCVLTCGQYLDKVPWDVERKCILWCLSGMFCRCVLSRIMMSFNPRVLLFSYCLTCLSIGDSGILNFPTVTVLESMYNLNLTVVFLWSVCGAYMFRMLMHSWFIFSLMSMMWSFQTFLTDLRLKSLLLDIKVAVLAFFLPLFVWSTIFPSFTLRWCWSLMVSCASWSQLFDRSYFLI